MRDESALVNLIAALMVVLVVGAAGYGCEAYKCGASWNGSGHASRFGIVAGCQVEESPGRWVPEKSYRVAP